jgi:cellulose synthase/poly-beta-1,6-N-acetylglucosamine synthase-like glycosyltransferase
LDTGLLTLLALALALLHFGVPLAYYSYLRVRWLSKPWGIAPDTNYRPRATVIIPTYNEAPLIIAEQDYPRIL